MPICHFYKHIQYSRQERQQFITHCQECVSFCQIRGNKGIPGVALKVDTSYVMDSDDVAMDRNTLAHSASAATTTPGLWGLRSCGVTDIIVWRSCWFLRSVRYLNRIEYLAISKCVTFTPRTRTAFEIQYHAHLHT